MLFCFKWPSRHCSLFVRGRIRDLLGRVRQLSFPFEFWFVFLWELAAAKPRSIRFVASATISIHRFRHRGKAPRSFTPCVLCSIAFALFARDKDTSIWVWFSEKETSNSSLQFWGKPLRLLSKVGISSAGAFERFRTRQQQGGIASGHLSNSFRVERPRISMAWHFVTPRPFCRSPALASDSVREEVGWPVGHVSKNGFRL